jgi:hypothetical protein
LHGAARSFAREQLQKVWNLHEFAGMLVFDKWNCNTNGRQTLLFRRLPGQHGRAAGAAEQDAGDSRQPAYETVMIDQGFCFNVGEWNYPDAPLRGLYTRNRVYVGVIGMESFGPWILRLEKGITSSALVEMMGEIPPEWYEDDYDAPASLGRAIGPAANAHTDLLPEAKPSNLARRCSDRRGYGIAWKNGFPWRSLLSREIPCG